MNIKRLDYAPEGNFENMSKFELLRVSSRDAMRPHCGGNTSGFLHASETGIIVSFLRYYELVKKNEYLMYESIINLSKEPNYIRRQ